MIKQKIVILFIGFLLVGSVFSLTQEAEFQIVFATFDPEDYVVTIVMKLSLDHEITVNTPTSALFTVEVLGENSQFWGISSAAFMVTMSRTISQGTHFMTYSGSLYQKVQTLVSLDLPHSLEIVVHMGDEFMTPPYTVYLQ